MRKISTLILVGTILTLSSAQTLFKSSYLKSQNIVNSYRFAGDDIPTDGLIAQWLFSGNANDDINGNDGTVYGATLTTDRFGNSNKAYAFNGDTIVVPDADIFSFVGDVAFSINLWIEKTTSPINGAYIGKWGGSTSLREWVFLNGGSANSYMRLDNGAGAFIRLDSDSTLSTSEWYMLTMVYDGSEATSGIDFYVDCKFVTNTTTGGSGTYTGMINTATDVYIGVLEGTGSSFNGKIDDIRMYNRELTQDDIDKLYGGFVK